MLLRSSSTPVLGSLLSSSFSASPNNNSNIHHETTTAAAKHHHLPQTTPHIHIHIHSHSHHNKRSFGSLNKGFHRARSEGNLEGLARASSNRCEDFKDRGRERVGMAVQGGEFVFKNEKTSTVFIEEVEVQEMYLASGLGIGSGGGGGSGGEFIPVGSSGGENDENNHGVEEYYKKMVEGNPGNPLFLRNYAQFLHQSKRELHTAEEYYSRAILADPGDGEILSQYAKLVWELHHDQERASTYFERAIQASAEQDSHVQAAYAGFLWETEEEDDAECRGAPKFQAAVVSATASA